VREQEPRLQQDEAAGSHRFEADPDHRSKSEPLRLEGRGGFFGILAIPA